jgi:glutamate formiminotransferase/formiminotetrahydrofolate cyclodeaminase
MEAFKLPKATDEQKQARAAAVEEATKQATLVPLEVLEGVPRALELALAVAERGNNSSASDAGVAGWALRTAAEGAWLNVRINLAGIQDAVFKGRVGEQGRASLERARELAGRVERAADVAIG